MQISSLRQSCRQAAGHTEKGVIETGRIIDWLGGIFKPPKAGIYDVSTYRADTVEEQAAIDAFALFSVVHLISGLLSGCEFRVFSRGKEQKGAEWAALNVKPNKNQNAAAWKREIVSRLLLSGEVLCIQLPDNQRIIAETFNRDDDVMKGDIFSNIHRADVHISRNYRAGEVIYMHSPVNARAAWLQQIMVQYEKMLSSAAKRLKKAGGEKGILEVSAVEQGKNGFSERFAKLQNEYFKNYFESSNAVLPLFDGYKYTPQSSGGGSGTYTNDLTSVKTLAEEAINRAAQVFGIPPSYVRGDAAGIKDSQAATMTNCIKPLAEMISQELTGKLFSVQEIASGSSIIVDTGSILHHDLIADSAGIDKLIGSGWTINEVRKALGDSNLDDPDADVRFITRNYGTLAEALKGGEGDADQLENGSQE